LPGLDIPHPDKGGLRRGLSGPVQLCSCIINLFNSVLLKCEIWIIFGIQKSETSNEHLVGVRGIDAGCIDCTLPGWPWDCFRQIRRAIHRLEAAMHIRNHHMAGRKYYRVWAESIVQVMKNPPNQICNRAYSNGQFIFPYPNKRGEQNREQTSSIRFLFYDFLF
jgi:hypothetical protein